MLSGSQQLLLSARVNICFDIKLVDGIEKNREEEEPSYLELEARSQRSLKSLKGTSFSA